MKISIIIPVFNGEKTIGELFKRIYNELEGNFSFEVIFVFDCGKDNSWAIITELKHNYPQIVKGIHLSKNYGQHNAILYGISKATGDLLITMDEDLQHDPVYIKSLVARQQEADYDVVYAVFRKLSHPGSRIRTSDLLRKVLKATVPGLFPNYSPYRLIKRNIAEEICRMRNSYTFIDGYLGMVARSFGTIRASHYKRADGVSSYSYYKLIKHASLIEIAYSPLKRWILLKALLLILISFVLLIAGEKLFDKYYLYLSGMIIGLFGVFFLFIGLLAEAIHLRRIKVNSHLVEKYIL